jgi:hypothetical protein
LLRQTSEKVDSRARGSRARFRRKPGSPSWIRASVGTSSVMVSFGGTGTGSLGTAPAESDHCRAATAKRWVAGGEKVGSAADRHPTAQKKECRGEEREHHRAGSPAGAAALNVLTAPVKKLQASLRRDYNREHESTSASFASTKSTKTAAIERPLATVAGVQHSVNRGKALRPKTAASLATIDEEAPKPDGQVTPGKSPYHP